VSYISRSAVLFFDFSSHSYSVLPLDPLLSAGREKDPRVADKRESPKDKPLSIFFS